MGTKANQSKFDCYNKAEPDEPMFVLLGRDPQAACLVSIWSKVRVGDPVAARAVFNHMIEQMLFNPNFPTYPREGTTDMEKSQEAMECSLAMFAFRKARIANQGVKCQADDPQESANPPGERG